MNKTIPAAVLEAAKSPNVKKMILTIKGADSVLIPLATIAYFKKEHQFVYAYSQDTNCHLVDVPNLSKLESLLPSNDFFRVDRQHIINIAYINRCVPIAHGKSQVLLKHGSIDILLTLSHLRTQFFRKWANQL